MLETEYRYYKKNRNAILEEYKDKFIVIKGEIISSYDTKELAEQDSEGGLLLFCDSSKKPYIDQTLNKTN